MTAAPMPPALYPSRAAAGTELGRLLFRRVTQPAVMVGVTPRGVEIAFHAARVLGSEFDVIVTSFVRVAGLGIIGAVAEDADAELDPAFQPRFGLMATLTEAIEKARRAVKTERLLYRGHRPIRDLDDAQVVLVEGPLTSPWKVLAAHTAIHALRPTKVFAAAPVCTQAVYDRIRARRLEFECPHVVRESAGHARPFAEQDDPSAERLRSIVVARDAA
jgi:predicted phosphoribosyltransferase